MLRKSESERTSQIIKRIVQEATGLCLPPTLEPSSQSHETASCSCVALVTSRLLGKKQRGVSVSERWLLPSSSEILPLSRATAQTGFSIVVMQVMCTLNIIQSLWEVGICTISYNDVPKCTNRQGDWVATPHLQQSQHYR